MEKILLISASTSLEDRLGELLDSPRHIARVSSWTEAHRVMSQTSPATVVVDEKLSAPSQASEVVRLDNVLGKDDKQAYLLSDDPDGEISQWPQMFGSIAGVIAPPKTPRQFEDLRQLLAPYLSSNRDSDSDTDDPLSTSSPSKEPTEVVVRLPTINAGSLANISLSRIIYSLHFRENTGVLHLKSGTIRRKFAFHNGRFLSGADCNGTDSLASAYAWPKGEFRFEPRNSLSGSPHSIYQLMITGLITHRPQRQLMNGLMSRMSTYPVTTQLWDQRQNDLEWDILSQFLEYCDGHQSLENIFSQMGNDVTNAFRAAAFSRDTDLVVFRADQTSSRIRLEYDHKSRAATSEPVPTSTKVERATGAGRGDLEDELSSFLQSMESMSSHDIFGVWEGCGREVVKQTYYSMVKEHHPDVYGGNVSGDVRVLAQKIFIKIRQAYTALMKQEDQQTVAPPDSPHSSGQRKPGRQKFATLHPGQSQPSPAASETGSDQRKAGRKKKMSTPIEMGRTPTSTHPDLKSRQDQNQAQTEQNSKKSSSSKRRSSTGAGNKRSRSSSTAGKRPKRTTSSVGGVGDEASDPKWRKEQLERLERSTSRRSTPMAKNKGKNNIPSPKSSRDPKKRAQKAFNAGYKKFKAQNFQKALPLFEKAHELDEDHGLYMTFLGYCLFQLSPESSKRSIKLLRQAIDTENRQALPDAHLFLGNILKANGNTDRAYKHFRKAYDLNPNSRDAQREIRLYERRNGKSGKQKSSKSDESGGFFKKLFKK